MSRLSVGDRAPGFDLETADAGRVALSDFAGGPVVVYFYPKADTSGCTTQACEFRDSVADYDAAGAPIVGISPDPPKKLAAFRDKHDLGFTLAADPDHAVCEAYGVWVEKQMYGRTYMGVERSTFVIAADGIVAHALYKVRPKGHAAAVLELIG